MAILPLRYQLKQLHKDKIMFEEDGILGTAYVDAVTYHFNGYHRFRTEDVERVLTLICQPNHVLTQSQATELQKVLEMNRLLADTDRARVLSFLSAGIPPQPISANSPYLSLSQQYGSEIYAVMGREPPC